MVHGIYPVLPTQHELSIVYGGVCVYMYIHAHALHHADNT